MYYLAYSNIQHFVSIGMSSELRMFASHQSHNLSAKQPMPKQQTSSYSSHDPKNGTIQ